MSEVRSERKRQHENARSPFVHTLHLLTAYFGKTDLKAPGLGTLEDMKVLSSPQTIFFFFLKSCANPPLLNILLKVQPPQPLTVLSIPAQVSVVFL